MGLAKEAEMWAFERRFGGVDGDVCSECVNDPAIRTFIEASAQALECSFCGRSSAEAIAAPADAVVDLISRSLKAEWNDPANELALDEGDYVGSYTDVEDILLWELDRPLGDGAFLRAVVDAGKDLAWCKRDYYAGDETESLLESWNDFADFVKHHSRYLFVWGVIDQQNDEEHVGGRRRPAEVASCVRSESSSTKLAWSRPWLRGLSSPGFDRSLREPFTTRQRSSEVLPPARQRRAA